MSESDTNNPPPDQEGHDGVGVNLPKEDEPKQDVGKEEEVVVEEVALTDGAKRSADEAQGSAEGDGDNVGENGQKKAKTDVEDGTGAVSTGTPQQEHQPTPLDSDSAKPDENTENKPASPYPGTGQPGMGQPQHPHQYMMMRGQYPPGMNPAMMGQYPHGMMPQYPGYPPGQGQGHPQHPQQQQQQPPYPQQQQQQQQPGASIPQQQSQGQGQFPQQQQQQPPYAQQQPGGMPQQNQGQGQPQQQQQPPFAQQPGGQQEPAQGGNDAEGNQQQPQQQGTPNRPQGPQGGMFPGMPGMMPMMPYGGHPGMFYGQFGMMNPFMAQAFQKGQHGGYIPAPTPRSAGISLALSCDDEQLSEYQMLVRKQLEIFEAQPEDVESNTQGRKKQVALGQVGLRCRHCAGFPLRQRGRGAVYYPAKLQGVYQAAQNMASSHLCESCQCIPPPLKSELRNLRDRRDTASGGKQYWADGARAMGLYETDEGLKLRRPETQSTGNNSTSQSPPPS